ncbi:MAG TPA: hypothetical protein VN841_27990 [Bryobacteraceae bacterium]|nr:hypothetical protein [Bryobacteraceae bacterium]
MKNTTFAKIRFLTLSGAIIGALPLHAAEPIEVHWNEVCRVAADHRLVITTVTGDTVAGYCMSINVDEMAVTTQDRQVVKIARTALSKIQMHRSKGHQLSSLGKGVRAGLGYGMKSLLSPYAPIGIVTVPATLAWGAVATPFCVLGELIDKVAGEQEIKVL